MASPTKEATEKEATEKAAAARFRSAIDRRQSDKLALASQDMTRPTNETTPERQMGLPVQSPLGAHPVQPDIRRRRKSDRPPPLTLTDVYVVPLEVQSARLPPRTSSRAASNLRDHARERSTKQHHRRMTISAPSNALAGTGLLCSPNQITSIEFIIPPVPPMSSSTSNASTPSSRVPLTPISGPSEDQARRELEAFTLDEGTDVLRSRKGSDKRAGVFIPAPEDTVSLPPPEWLLQIRPDLAHGQPTKSQTLESQPAAVLTRKKSFFDRFQRKTDVEKLLDLYMSDKQIEESNAPKRKASTPKRYVLFRSRSQPDPTTDSR